MVTNNIFSQNENMERLLVRARARFVVDLRPDRVQDVMGGVREQLASMLLLWNEDLGGVVVGFDEEQLTKRQVCTCEKCCDAAATFTAGHCLLLVPHAPCACPCQCLALPAQGWAAHRCVPKHKNFPQKPHAVDCTQRAWSTKWAPITWASWSWAYSTPPLHKPTCRAIYDLLPRYSET